MAVGYMTLAILACQQRVVCWQARIHVGYMSVGYMTLSCMQHEVGYSLANIMKDVGYMSDVGYMKESCCMVYGVWCMLYVVWCVVCVVCCVVCVVCCVVCVVC